MAEVRILRVSRVRLLVDRRGVLRLLVDGAALVLLGEQLLDLPVVLLDADGELEVLAGDGVPVLFLDDPLARGDRFRFHGRGNTNLVDHHDGEEVADGGEEQAVQVVLDAVADGVAEDVQDDLADDEEEDAEDDVAERPAVLECAHDEDDLADEVDEEEDGVHDVGDDEDADWVLGVHTRPILKCEKGDGTANNEHGKGGQAQQPDRQGRAVFVQLETDKAVDEQAGAEGGYKAVLGSGEVRVRGRTRGSDAGIEDERDNGQEEVDVEERGDLLAACNCVLVRLRKSSSSRAHTDSGELGTDVEDHDNGHDEGQNVHEVVCDLKDERVCDLNGACIALGLYAGAAIDLLVAYERAQRYRRLCAYCREVAKAHDEGCSKDLGVVAVGALFSGAAARLCCVWNSKIWAERQPKAWQQRPGWVGSGEDGLIASV